MQRIGPNAHATLKLDLALADGTEVHRSEAMEYVHGYGLLVPGLERRLAGKKAGDRFKAVIAPEEGFGEYDEDLVLVLERSELPAECEVDDEFEAESEDGELAVFRVVELNEEEAVVDANHPLAGETLHYETEVVTVRAATEGEIAEAARMFEEARTQIEVDPEPPQVMTAASLKRT